MNKRWTMVLLVSAIVATSSLACTTSGWQYAHGSGRVVEKEFEVHDFTGVELATFGDLYIELGDEEALRVEAEDNLIQYFDIAVHGDVLEINSRPDVPLHPTRPVNFYLTVKLLDTIVVSGSGDVEAPDLEAERISGTISGSGDVDAGDLKADAVELYLSGSGNLDVSGCATEGQEITILGSGDVTIGHLAADVLKVQITGSGNLDVLDGDVGEQKISLTGSGDYTAGHLKSATADVRIGGSGSTTVHVDQQLEARIIGSGDVHYVGRPTVKQAVMGSGDVVQVGN